MPFELQMASWHKPPWDCKKLWPGASDGLWVKDPIACYDIDPAIVVIPPYRNIPEWDLDMIPEPTLETAKVAVWGLPTRSEEVDTLLQRVPIVRYAHVSRNSLGQFMPMDHYLWKPDLERWVGWHAEFDAACGRAIAALAERMLDNVD